MEKSNNVKGYVVQYMRAGTSTSYFKTTAVKSNSIKLDNNYVVVGVHPFTIHNGKYYARDLTPFNDKNKMLNAFHYIIDGGHYKTIYRGYDPRMWFD